MEIILELYGHLALYVEERDMLDLDPFKVVFLCFNQKVHQGSERTMSYHLRPLRNCIFFCYDFFNLM